jgi:uncharacterized RDD family membrane protein YckC
MVRDEPVPAGHAEPDDPQLGEAGWGEADAGRRGPDRGADRGAWRNPTAVLARRTGAVLIDGIVLLLAARSLQELRDWSYLLALIAPVTVLLVVVQGLTSLTVGKALLGLRTIRADGRPPGILACFVRTTLWVLDGAPWFVPLLGPIVALRSIGHQRLGDMAADTFVVGARDAGRPVVMPWLSRDVERLEEVYEFAGAHALRWQLGFERALSRTASALMPGEALVSMAAGRSSGYGWNAVITVTDQRAIIVSQRRWRLFPSLNVESLPHGKISAVDRGEGMVWATVRLYTSSKTTELYVWRGSAPGLVTAILDAKAALEGTDRWSGD